MTDHERVTRPTGFRGGQVPPPATVREQNSQLDQLIAFENGELDEDATVELFQGLVDTGLVWQLQGTYGRTAVQLIEAGKIHFQGDI